MSAIVTGGAPKEALQAKQPTAEQTATIRQAYANANLPASEATTVIQNPAAAQQVYGNIARASQPQQQQQAQPQEETTTTTERVYSTRPPFQQNILAQGSDVELLPYRPPASTTRFSQSLEGGYTFTDIPRSVYAQGPIIRFRGPPTTNQLRGYTEFYRGPQQTNTDYIYNSPRAVRARNAVDIINIIPGNFFRATSQGYQRIAESIPGAQNPGIARFFQGEAYVAAGFTNLLAFSFGRSNTSLPQTGPVLVGEAISFGVQGYLAGEALSSFEGIAGIRALSTPVRFLARTGVGALIGTGQTALAGGNILAGAGLGVVTFGVGGLVGERIASVLPGAREFLVEPRPNPSQVPAEDPYQLSLFSRVAQRILGPPTPLTLRSSGSVFGSLSDELSASSFAKIVTDRLGTSKTPAAQEFAKFLEDYGGGGNEVNVGGGQVQIASQVSRQTPQTEEIQIQLFYEQAQSSAQTQISLEIPKVQTLSSLGFGALNVASLEAQRLLIRARARARIAPEEESISLTTPRNAQVPQLRTIQQINQDTVQSLGLKELNIQATRQLQETLLEQQQLQLQRTETIQLQREIQQQRELQIPREVEIFREPQIIRESGGYDFFLPTLPRARRRRKAKKKKGSKRQYKEFREEIPFERLVISRSLR